MEELPSNSHKARGRQDKDEPKKVEKVIQSSVSRRKKPLNRRLKEFFIGDSADSIMEYVIHEILVPSSKDMVADAVNMGMEKRLYGGSRYAGRRTGRRPSDGGYVSYNRFSSSSRNQRDEPRDRDRDRDRDRPSRRGRSVDIDDIIIPSRVEAEEVLDTMSELLDKYDVVTLSDLYSLCGIEGNYTDEKYGWEDLRGARVQRVPNGYLLDLPRPEPIR